MKNQLPEAAEPYGVPINLPARAGTAKKDQVPGRAYHPGGMSASKVAKSADGRSSRLGMSNTERSEQTRRELLAAAAEAFDQRGYLGTSLNDITERLGLTKGALYFHYPSKEALAVAVVEAHYERWDPLAASIVGRSVSRLDDLVILSYKVAEAFQHDVIVRAGVRLQAERDLISTAMPRPYVEWIKRVTELAQAAKNNGELASGVDPADVGNVVVGMFFGAQYVSQALTGRRDLKKRLDQFWKLTLPTIKATGVASRRSQARANVR